MNTAILENIRAACEADINYGYSLPEQETVSTGIPQLDAATGGIPLGRIVEIFGAEDGGKTALALHLAQQIGGPVLYVDADHKLSPYILNGCDPYLLNLETLEDTLNACETAIIGGFKVVVIDSLAALPTRIETEDSINCPYGMPKNRQAKLLAHAVPILVPLLHKSGCTLILVNQLRENPSVMYGRPDKPTGGNTVKYFAALRLETRRCEKVKRSKDFIGQKIAVDVRKCKYAPPGKRAILTLTYGEGLSA